MGKLGLYTPVPQDQAQLLTPTTPAELALLASSMSTTTIADDIMTEGTRSGLDRGLESMMVTPTFDFDTLFENQMGQGEEDQMLEAPSTTEALVPASAQPVVKLAQMPKGKPRRTPKTLGKCRRILQK